MTPDRLFISEEIGACGLEVVADTAPVRVRLIRRRPQGKPRRQKFDEKTEAVSLMPPERLPSAAEIELSTVRAFVETVDLCNAHRIRRVFPVFIDRPSNRHRSAPACRNLDLSQRNLDDKKQYPVLDMDFHLAIARASRNSIISRSIEMLKALYTVWLSNFQIVHGNTKSNQLHHQIFEAIKNRDAERARSFMTEHLSDVLHKGRLDAARKPQALCGEESDSEG